MFVALFIAAFRVAVKLATLFFGSKGDFQRIIWVGSRPTPTCHLTGEEIRAHQGVP